MRSIRRLLLQAAPVAAIAALALVVAPAPASAAGPYHEATIQEAGATAFFKAITLQDATASPAGVNVPCTPSAAHPYPVVLLHGAGGNRYTNWAYLGPHLANAGYCVYALNYGGISPTFVFQGTLVGGFAGAADQINAFIDQVLAETHASQVDLVGHSEGGLMSLYIPKLTDHAAQVHAVIGMGSPTQGSTVDGLTTLGDAIGFTKLLNFFGTHGCGPCGEAPIPGSLITMQLNAGGVAVPGIRYTEIASTRDFIVTPAQNAFIPIADQPVAEQPLITNVLIQDVCPADHVGHVGEAYDGNVAQVVLNALDPAHPTPVVCGKGGPGF